MTLKLKRTPGLYLVGFMASGKTTVGGLLADELGWCFIDIDREIEGRERRTIAQIFEERGEAAFREMESTVLARHVSEVRAGNPRVVAVGGGAFAHSRNWEIVENNGVTVWLDCSLDRIHERLGEVDKSRPLSFDRGAMRELFDTRRPLYARADYHINANCDHPSEVVRKILDLPIF